MTSYVDYGSVVVTVIGAALIVGLVGWYLVFYFERLNKKRRKKEKDSFSKSELFESW